MRNFFAILAAVSCLFSAQAFGQANATATIASDYNWRGISFNNYSGAAVQGDMSYSLPYNFTLGVWASNLAYPANFFGGYEADPYLTYTHQFGDISAYATFMWYTFSRFSKANTTEVTLGMKWKDLHISIGQLPEYFSFESKSLYYQASYAHPIGENLWAAAQVGHTDFSDFIASLWGDYTHYKLGVQYRKDKMTMEMAFSKTDREINGATEAAAKTKQNDDATIVTLTMQL